MLMMALLLVTRSWATDPAGTDRGHQVYAARCQSCHSLEESTAPNKWVLAYQQKGPLLAFAGNKFRPEFLRNWLQYPAAIRPEGYPYFRYVVTTSDGDRIGAAPAPHPTVGGAELDAVVSYLSSLILPEKPYPHTEPLQSVSGRVLFSEVFGCASCHQIASSDLRLRSGPSLVGVGRRLNEEWLASFINAPQDWNSPNMPHIRLRADQLAALVRYVADTPAGETSSLAAREPLPSDAKAPPPLDINKRGAVIYRVVCSQCHGVNGDGHGINARYLSVEPRNHSSKEEMGKLSDDHLRRVIRYGGTSVDKSALMPAWGGLFTDAEVDDLVTYLRELSR
jgi:cytochrome c oxidase cbb3-type subunit 3